jgi:photosystem II stability/assembly factor-like uncharacterized protein
VFFKFFVKVNLQKMKKIFLFVITLLIAHCTLKIEYCEAQWVRSSLTYNGTINALASNGSKIFAGVSVNGVYISTNNGNSWTQSVLNNRTIQSLAVDSNNLFAGSDSIYHSTNSGISWSVLPLPEGRPAYSLALNGNRLFAGSISRIFQTTNIGLSWMQTSYADHSFHALAIKGNIVFASLYGFSNGLYLSSNSGISWTEISFNSFESASSFVIIGDNIFAGTYGNNTGGVYLSTNNGLNWTLTALNNQGVWSVTAISNNIFAGTQSNGIFYSSNNGQNWTQINQGFGFMPLAKTLLIANDYIYAGLNENSLWRRPLSEIINGVNNNKSEIPSAYLLEQNYPNPFNPNTIIRFQIKDSRFVTLKVYDLLGKEVAKLVNEKQAAGIYDVSFDGSNLTSGIYFYSLFMDWVKIGTKRMVLLK